MITLNQSNRKFERLGVMVDMARNAAMTTDSLKQLADMLSAMDYNEFYLYTEDLLEVDDEPYFGYMRGRYTKAEMRELDEYFASRNITVVPCIQTLAHLARIKRYADYGDHFDIDDILLADDERVYLLIERVFKMLAENFSSRRVHIGMDEAIRLGRGEYQTKHGVVPRMEIYVKHLKKVLAIADKYGFKCEIWADMFLEHSFGADWGIETGEMKSDVIGLLPQNVRLINWNYGDQPKELFVNHLKALKQLTSDIGFAGGVPKFGFAPDNDYGKRNVNHSMPACIEEGVTSYLLTAWGDGGGECSVFSILPLIYHTACLSHGQPTSGTDFEQGFLEITGVDYKTMNSIDLVNKPLDKDYPMRNNQSSMYLYQDLLCGCFDELLPDGLEEGYAKRAKFMAGFENCRFGYLFTAARVLCEIAGKKVYLGKKIRAAYEAKDNYALKSLANEIDQIIILVGEFYDAFKKQWLKINKPFGLEVQAIRLGGLKQRLADVAERLRDYADGKLPNIPELDEKLLPTGWWNGRWQIVLENCLWLDWQRIVTAGAL